MELKWIVGDMKFNIRVFDNHHHHTTSWDQINRVVNVFAWSCKSLNVWPNLSPTIIASNINIQTPLRGVWFMAMSLSTYVEDALRSSIKILLIHTKPIDRSIDSSRSCAKFNEHNCRLEWSGCLHSNSTFTRAHMMMCWLKGKTVWKGPQKFFARVSIRQRPSLRWMNEPERRKRIMLCLCDLWLLLMLSLVRANWKTLTGIILTPLSLGSINSSGVASCVRSAFFCLLACCCCCRKFFYFPDCLKKPANWNRSQLFRSPTFVCFALRKTVQLAKAMQFV